jgi:hypothetical protein
VDGSFSGDDCVYWIAVIEPTVASRKEAAELAALLMRLDFFRPVADAPGTAFREGLDVLYRYRHDELELERLAGMRAARVQSGPAALTSGTTASPPAPRAPSSRLWPFRRPKAPGPS